MLPDQIYCQEHFSLGQSMNWSTRGQTYLLLPKFIIELAYLDDLLLLT